MRDQVGAAHATSWDNLWGGLRSARNALNSSHTGRKPRPPRCVSLKTSRQRAGDCGKALILVHNGPTTTRLGLHKPETRCPGSDRKPDARPSRSWGWTWARAQGRVSRPGVHSADTPGTSGPDAYRPAMRSDYEFRPGGLRTGSPPSPPPRLIRPTVRLLPRSPRLSRPGPH
jgi:hypothetical protein